MKKIIIIAAVIFITFSLSSCSHGSPKSVVDSYFNALQKGDYTTAMSYTTLNDEEIQEQAKKLEGLEFKVSEYEILDETINDDKNTATVQVKYKFTSLMGENEVNDKEIKLIKKDKQWKIEE